MADGSAFTQYLRTFVLPLVAGGHLQVRGLVGPGMLARFRADADVDATLLMEIQSHVQSHLAEIGPTADVNVLPPDAIALTVVWHNLLAMTHPEVAGRTRLRRRVRQWSLKMLEWIDVPHTAHEVAMRHGVLARLADVGRVDTDVAFWAGSARFVGVAPPRRLLLWPDVRRVREEKKRVPLFDLLERLESPDERSDLLHIARLALTCSPLTDVALVDRPEAVLAFRWTPSAVNALGDVALRGAVVRLALRQGGNGAADATLARVRMLEQATRTAVEAGVTLAGARVLATLHLELLVTEALARGAPPTAHALAWDAIGRLGTARVAAVVGMEASAVERALVLDRQRRVPLKDAPAQALLVRAGWLEEST